VQLPEGQAINPEFLELYSPIINVSKHYHWALGMQVNDPTEINDSNNDVDLVISNSTVANGHILGTDFWEGSNATKSENGSYYAEVDAKMKPELVLDRLATLA
jgi:hypothetical protein